MAESYKRSDLPLVNSPLCFSLGSTDIAEGTSPSGMNCLLCVCTIQKRLRLTGVYYYDFLIFLHCLFTQESTNLTLLDEMNKLNEASSLLKYILNLGVLVTTTGYLGHLFLCIAPFIVEGLVFIS